MQSHTELVKPLRRADYHGCGACYPSAGAGRRDSFFGGGW